MVDVISGYVNLDHDEEKLIGRCPFCDSDSLTVDETKQTYSCGQCAEEGSVIQFLMNMEGITLPEACRRMADLTGIEINESDEATYVSVGGGRSCVRKNAQSVINLIRGFACLEHSRHRRTAIETLPESILKKPPIIGSNFRPCSSILISVKVCRLGVT